MGWNRRHRRSDNDIYDEAEVHGWHFSGMPGTLVLKGDGISYGRRELPHSQTIPNWLGRFSDCLFRRAGPFGGFRGGDRLWLAWVPAEGQRVRIAGVLVEAPDPRTMCAYEDEHLVDCCPFPRAAEGGFLLKSVAYVWTAEASRQRGVARTLAKLASPQRPIAWHPPFSPAGLALAQSLSPSGRILAWR